MLSYALAVLVSMVVALTVTPALCLLLLSRGKLASKESRLCGAEAGVWRTSGTADSQAPPAIALTLALLSAECWRCPLGSQCFQLQGTDFLMHG